VDRKSPRKLSLEEAKPAILERIAADKRAQVMREYIESLRSKAKIEIAAD